MMYGIEKNKKLHISQHFTSDEIKCRCDNPLCNYTIYSPLFIEMLEHLRVSCGARPLHITSFYRCQSHNEKIGGKKASFHTVGLAADLYHEKLPLEEVAYRAKALGFDYCYIGEGFVHLDMRSLIKRS